jgi:hypothetical protein
MRLFRVLLILVIAVLVLADIALARDWAGDILMRKAFLSVVD